VVRRFGPAALVALAVIAACGKPAGPISLSFVPPAGSTPAVVRVSGLSSSELASLERLRADDPVWPRLLRVAVDAAPQDSPAIVGRYAVSSLSLDFTPTYPFDLGRNYVATLDPAQLPSPRSDAPVRLTLGLRAETPTPTTTVVRMLPTADTLPENLLRVYLEFSAPMARDHGRDYLKLLDEKGQEVKDAFLALDVDFWSPDGRRYTVFFDPGRVKRGILPNDLFGRALVPGHRFTIAVDPRWRDANGQPLASAFQRTFAVGPVDMAPIKTDDWRIHAPAAGSRDPVVVAFPKPLDHGLLQRALGVAIGGVPLEGDIAIASGETEWRFTPRAPWSAKRYDLVVLAILEDPMGNKIGRSFDVDSFTEVDKSPVPERITLPIVVR
jgi:hypothetical protein